MPAVISKNFMKIRSNIGAEPDLVIFMLARIFGVAVRPLSLLICATLGYDDFSDNWVLILTALASSFVLIGNDAHIDLYRHLFNRQNNILATYVMTRLFVKNTITHILIFIIPAAAIFYLWTPNFALILLAVPMLLGEKFYDDYQRFSIFEKNYLRWSLIFCVRTIIPTSYIIIGALLNISLSLYAFIIIYLICFIVYFVGWKRRLLWLYIRLYRHKLRTIHELPRYVKIYFGLLGRNHLSLAIQANTMLLDRVIILGTAIVFSHYIFFSMLFNMIAISHNILYFTQRRPTLIKHDTHPLKELFKAPNLLMPLFFSIGSLAAAFIIIHVIEGYKDFAWLIIIGMPFHYFILAISLVIEDYCYFRIDRLKLSAINIILYGIPVGIFLGLSLPAIFIPYVFAITALLKLIILSFLATQEYQKEKLS